MMTSQAENSTVNENKEPHRTSAEARSPRPNFLENALRAPDFCSGPVSFIMNVWQADKISTATR